MGSELRKPLGIAVVGGLVVSQILTIYTTPVVFLAFERLRVWGNGLGHSLLRSRKHSPSADRNF